MYTVKQLASLTGISARALHYYDQIGLLKPTLYESNGYRRYDQEAVYRLQQILFYKELGLCLEKIREIIDQPGFDPLRALEDHKKALRRRQERLDALIHTIDQTILHLKGQTAMSNKQMFEPFTEQQQKEYEEEAAERWPEPYTESARRWKSYTEADKQRIGDEGNAIYTDMVAALDQDPGSEAVQNIVRRWHQHLRYFYEPSVEILRGLGRMYLDDPRFAATFARIHPDLAAFHQRAIDIYCDRLQGVESR